MSTSYRLSFTVWWSSAGSVVRTCTISWEKKQPKYISWICWDLDFLFSFQPGVHVLGGQETLRRWRCWRATKYSGGSSFSSCTTTEPDPLMSRKTSLLAYYQGTSSTVSHTQWSHAAELSRSLAEPIRVNELPEHISSASRKPADRFLSKFLLTKRQYVFRQRRRWEICGHQI